MTKALDIAGKLAEPIDRILFSEEEIQERVKSMGEQITLDYQGKDLLVICILTGALYFTADLIRHIKIPMSLDFIAVSSYGDSTKTSGIARITKDLEEDIEGRNILIVEDIMDTGLTLDYLIKLLRLRKPADIKICSLLNKPHRRTKENIQPDYKGFELDNFFVVGYGLDYKQKFRHLPFVCVFKDKFVPKQ